MTASGQVLLNDGVLSVSGTISAQTAAGLRAEGEKLIGAVDKELIVDLERLETAHSVVLSMLLCWQRLACQRGVSLSYRAVGNQLVSLAALSNLGDQLPGFDSGSPQPLH